MDWGRERECQRAERGEVIGNPCFIDLCLLCLCLYIVLRKKEISQKSNTRKAEEKKMKRGVTENQTKRQWSEGGRDQEKDGRKEGGYGLW